MTEAKKWIEEQDFLWLSVTEEERLIKAYEAGQKDSEAQIEKMKCCENCKKYWRMCEYGDREMQICEKWEIAEND